MKQYQATTFSLIDDKDDVFITTSHEEGDRSITIHTIEAYIGFYLHITQEQAKDLIWKLRQSIRNLEVEKQRKQPKEV